MKNYISRPLYIRRIEPFIDKSIIKVITGQRRIGKSYILLQISDIIKKNIPEANIIFVDKEQLAFTEIRNYMDLYQYVLKKVIGHNHNYLFVDEIQEIEEFQLCLRSLLNENRCDIYCTGNLNNFTKTWNNSARENVFFDPCISRMFLQGTDIVEKE